MILAASFWEKKRVSDWWRRRRTKPLQNSLHLFPPAGTWRCQPSLLLHPLAWNDLLFKKWDGHEVAIVYKQSLSWVEEHEYLFQMPCSEIEKSEAIVSKLVNWFRNYSKVLKIHTFLISSYLTHGDLTIPIDMFNIFGLSFPNGPVVNSTLWHSHFTWWKISWATQWSSGRWKWLSDGVVDRKVRKWHRILTQKQTSWRNMLVGILNLQD